MWGMNPEQQKWWAHFLQTQAAYHQAQVQQQMQLSPWNQPGWMRFSNPLLSRAASAQLTETDPNAAMMPYFLGQMGGGGDNQQGGMNPMMWQMAMGNQ